MARMHTGKRGKSKSRKPELEPGMQAEEAKISKAEAEKIIEGYSKQGVNPALIGQYLKDKHGVPYVRQLMGKRLMQVLKEKGAATELPSDLLSLMRKAVGMRKHLSGNKQDVHNRTRLVRTESKIWRLSKYYKKEGVLPKTWTYDPEQAALIIKG
jgi:small subunit ribosomal protein S15